MATKKKQKLAPATKASAPILANPETVEEQVLASMDELTFLAPADGTTQYVVPERVKQTVVTKEDVTVILPDEIKSTTKVREQIKPSKANMAKVSVPDVVLEDEIQTTTPLTEVHRAVIDGVLSQLAAGNTTFTSAMLYRAMTGKESGSYIHKDRQEMLDEIMSQLMYLALHIEIDIIDKDGNPGRAKLDGPVIPAERVEAYIAGQKCTAYRITGQPILWRYCRATQNVAIAPISFLSIEMNYTTRNIVILNVIQRKVAPILYPTNGVYVKQKPLVIPYSGIFDAAKDVGETQTNLAMFRRRTRDVIKTILDTWVAGGYIKKWEEIKEGREFVACKITFPDKAPPSLPPTYKRMTGKQN